MTFTELESYLTCELNLKPYRARQIFSWLHFRRAASFHEMTDISIKLRKKLSAICEITVPDQTRTVRSSDGTVKHLLKLPGGPAESVLIPDPPRFTACLSTQYGCRMGCRFCMTGSAGYHGNMDAADILAQLYSIAGTPPTE